ncbi:sterol desaturase family protein [Microseira wollei]|uniref:Sterol desaturase-like protein n=1 Tax=Microseira wollei NIES-4236 TaxID=2530354 RepID=A0AAV3XKT2_9CYAN|nr:sterol desaturase family protein [Microseira wollei]GET43547.1 sterol desaturase-like protein [Microseira wollei NIES-4236]
MIEIMSIQLILWSVFFLTGAVFWLWEISSPLHQIKYKAKCFKELGWIGISIVFSIIIACVTAAIMKLLNSLFIGELEVSAGVMYVPVWLRLIAAYLLQDFSYYLLHRTMHMNRFFWLTHKWHHSTKQSWWLTGGKESLTGGLLNYFTFVWFPLLEIPSEVMAVVAVHQAVHSNWIHLNVKWNSWLGILEWIYVTPRVHSLHHIDPKGRNLSLIFTFYDRLFGTYVCPENFELKKYENRLDDESVAVKTIVGV